MSNIESLAEVMVKFYQFMRWSQHEPQNQTEDRMENYHVETKYIIPALLPPARNFKSAFVKRAGTKSLVYFFHQSWESNKVKSSGFLPYGSLPILVASLLEEKPNRIGWEKNELFSDGASFRTGTHGDLLVVISSQGCVVTLKVLTVAYPECEDINAEISSARYAFEQEIMRLLGQDLHCSVCVSPCHKSSAINKSNYGCLHILGRIGKVGKQPLWSAMCKTHKNYPLPSKAYGFWFYNERSLRDNPQTAHKDDQKLLNKIAKTIGDLDAVRDIGIELGIDMESINRTINESDNKIKRAAFNVLYMWYNAEVGNLQRGSPKYNQLKEAINESRLPNVMN